MVYKGTNRFLLQLKNFKHYVLPRTQRFLFQAKNRMTLYLWLRTEGFLFQSKNYDGAQSMAKDPTSLISGEKL